MKEKKRIKKIVTDGGSLYPVVVQSEKSGGYWALCPAFEGCYSQGESIEAVLNNIADAIKLCKEAPRPVHSFKHISVHLVRA